MKATFTIEDLPDGALLMQSDPPMDALLQAAQHHPQTLTHAQAMAVVVWDAMLHAARRMAKDRSAAMSTGTYAQPSTARH